MTENTTIDQKYVDNLIKKKLKCCPFCDNKSWDGNGYLNLPIAKTLLNYFPVFSEEYMPCISLSCTNCGFIAIHHLGKLGLDIALINDINKRKNNEI